MKFTSVPFPEMATELKSGAISAAVMPEPFSSGLEQAEGGIPLVDLNQGATTSFPVEGYVVTKQWAAKYPHTLAAFYKALEEGQQIADTSRAAVEAAMEDMPAPFGVSNATAAIMGLGQLSGQHRTGRQRGQDPAAARRQRHAAVHRLSLVQHRLDADGQRLRPGEYGRTGLRTSLGAMILRLRQNDLPRTASAAEARAWGRTSVGLPPWSERRLRHYPGCRPRH